jgi:hypothetical protein
MVGIASRFAFPLAAHVDFFNCKAECKKMLIVDFAKPDPYALLCRIVFGLHQPTYQARLALRIYGMSFRRSPWAFCRHGVSIHCLVTFDYCCTNNSSAAANAKPILLPL